jgi:8-oxo-dGTP pyrophosphatase MutT (NUDIX family)
MVGAMETSELLELSRKLATAELAPEYRERLRIITDQLHVLESDERRAEDQVETTQRRHRLQTGIEQIAHAVSPGMLTDFRKAPEYRGGAILAFRFAEETVLREAIAGGLEEGIPRAIRATRELSGVHLPELEMMGGAADLWFFSERPERAAKTDMLRAFFYLGLQIQRQAADSGATPAFLLDWEDDATYFTSPGGRTVLSSRLRFAQEALLGTKAGHILISEDCRRSLSISGGPLKGPMRDSIVSIFGCPDARLSCALEDLPPLMPSHTPMLMVAVVFNADNEMIAGSPSAYTEFTAIEHRENIPGKRRGEPFIRLLAAHDECVIVGITNEHLAKRYLIPALADRRKAQKGFWDRMVVIFPSAEATSRVNEERASDDRLHRRASGLRTVISFLTSEGPSAQSWKVVEYEGNLPFVGNWMSGGSPSSIRISPILPGCNVDESFVVELPESTMAYAEALNSFLAIEGRSIEVGEWNLLGTASDDVFKWTGIVNRSESSRESANLSTYGAIVLILVHGVTSRGRRVYLQLRSNLNGSTALGLYSNISGKVTIKDAYDAAGLSMPPLISPGDAEALMSDVMRQNVLVHNEQIPRAVWLRAAIREVYEELGLRIDESRLVDHGHLSLVRPERDSSLFFQIFSLELTSTIQDRKPMAEIAAIRHNRTGSGMNEEFTLRDIQRLADGRRLNALMATRLDYFLDIYGSLKISDE